MVDLQARASSRREGFEAHIYRWDFEFATQWASKLIAPLIISAHFLFDAWLCLMISLVLPLRSFVAAVIVCLFFACLALVFAKQFPRLLPLTVVVALIVSAYSGQTIARHLHHYRSKLLSAELELQRRETTDPLTGIANRREFHASLRMNCSVIRVCKTLSLLVIDLNHLQQINLSYGANVGDIVLTEVSKRIKHCDAAAMIVRARYGTEEFCVLLPRGR